MSIFSRLKKAKKAAEDHKKAVESPAAEPKPPPVPYKHKPTHAAEDALAASPMAWSPEETRARIAAARKHRAQKSISSAPPSASRTAYQSYSHSRANSEINLPTRAIHRARSDLSIDSVIQKSRRQTFQPPPPSRGRQPVRSGEDYSLYPSQGFHAVSTPANQVAEQPLPPLPQVHTAGDYHALSAPRIPTPDGLHTVSAPQLQFSEEFHGFSAPREAPSPPLRKPKSQYFSRSGSNTSLMGRKSPLCNVSVGEVDDILSHSSDNSAYSRASSHSSNEGSPTRSGSSQSNTSLSRTKFPTLPMPSFVSHRRQPTIEISLPYISDDDLKTASSSMPTWRYEDFAAETEPPEIVQKISPSHSRKSSYTHSIFHRRGPSISSH